MPSDAIRQRLASEQAALVNALIGGATPPADFDASRIEAAAQALARKRSRSVAKVWPALTRGLGERFKERFAEFAAATPLPEYGGQLADGWAFARFLAARGELPTEARLEMLAVDLSYVSTSRGLLPRRGFAVRVALLRPLGRLVVGGRVPWFGAGWWSMRLYPRSRETGFPHELRSGVVE